MDEVLLEIWINPKHVKGVFARDKYALEVAALASLGFISTQTARHEFGKIWRITLNGLKHLKEQAIL